MRRADAGVTAYVEVALVESTATSITALKIQTLSLIMTASTKEQMNARFCTLATWRKEALMLMILVGAAIAW